MLKKYLRKQHAPSAEGDDETRREACAIGTDAMPIGDVAARQPATLVGEISTVRIVPQPDGSPWLEVTIADATGSIVAMWTGRHAIGGIKPGQRLAVTGRGAPSGPGGRLVFYNPIYELL